jgi:hypothetical protein
MHREILGSPPGFDVHHVNGDTLDNRRANLRALSRSEHMMSRGKARGRHTSPFKGVWWSRARRKWRTRLSIRGQSIHLGNFDDPVSAALAYDAAATSAYGPVAYNNFDALLVRRQAVDWIRSGCTRIIRVIFRKRTDGSIRSMLARVVRRELAYHPRGGALGGQAQSEILLRYRQLARSRTDLQPRKVDVLCGIEFGCVYS